MFIQSLNARIGSQESWTSAKSANGRFDWVGGGDRKKMEGLSTSSENSEFPVFPWLKGDKSVITLTTADHDCLQARFASYSSCHIIEYVP